MSIDTKLKEMGLVLPKATDPVGSYVATKISGNLLYISGQISMDAEGQLIKGKVGKDLNTEQAYKAAQRCALNIIAQAKKACSDDLSKIKSCIKLTGFVNSTNDFIEQPKVINGAPLITLGCSIKSLVEFTKPVNLMHDLIFDKSSEHAFLA